MRYIKQLRVPQHEAVEMEKIVAQPCPDVKRNGVEFDREVVFADGMRMIIQVCGPGEPEAESCWTQGVLFTPAGNEVGTTDVGESFLGEYCIDYARNEYVVNVEKLDV